MPPRTLDLSKFRGAGREAFAQEVLEGFAEDGFIKIVGHGLSEDDILKLLAWNEAFFALPLEKKTALNYTPGPEPQRGYQAVGVEKTATLNLDGEINMDVVSHGELEDVKETIDIGGAKDLEAPNRWPDEADIPGFRAWVEGYWERCHGIALELLAALELGLGLPATSMARRCDGSQSVIRLNHYPATPVARLRDSRTAMRIWPHTDAGAITLLVQDGRGGLEIEDQARPGTFVPLPPAGRAELVVNGGETLERWTNGRLRAGLHQVTVPSHVKDQVAAAAEEEEEDPDQVLPPRHSVAFFVNANPDSSMAPIPQMLAPGEAPKFDDMTAIAYHRMRNAVVY